MPAETRPSEPPLASTAAAAAQPAPGPPVSDAKHTAIVSLGQATTMVMGGVLALLIAHYFGKSAKTDAFFAAYGVASVAIVFGQTFRLTALPRLVDDTSGEATQRMLASVAVIALAAAIPMIALAVPVGSVLVKTDPGGTAPDALRVLWPAVAGQLLASMLAAVLAVRGRFMVIGAAYIVAGILSVLVFVLLESPLGIQGVSVGLDAAAALLVATFVLALRREGWRPSLSGLRDGRALRTEIGHLLVASATFVAMNVGYVVCVAVASRSGAGEVTLYSYAYFSAAILVAVTAVSAAMVRAPTLLSEARSAERTAESGVATYRVTLVVVLPVLALAAMVGQPVISFVLGGAYDKADTTRLVVTLLCETGWVLGSAAGVFAVVELLARERIRELALIAVGQVVVLAGLAIVGRDAWGIRGIALAQSLAMLAATALQLRLAFGTAWLSMVRRIAAATGRGLGAIALAFAPGTVLILLLGYEAAVVIPAALLSVALVPLVSRIAWPDEWRLLASVSGRGARQPA